MITTSNQTKRVLLTGFEPFGNHSRNPSGELAQSLDSEAWEQRGVELFAAQLPVDYRRVGALLPVLLDRLRPDLLLMFGVMSKPGVLRLEQRGLNRLGAGLDNSGYSPASRLSSISGPEQLPVSIDWDKPERDLKAAGFEVERSQDAGGYLCNFSLYKGLEWAQRRSPKSRVGFVHVPPYSEAFVATRYREAAALILEALLT